jgi:uncharacterized protein (TIGR02246 family)
MTFPRPVGGFLPALPILPAMIALLSTAACAPQTPAANPADVAATEATIRQLDADWVKAAATHRADAWTAFYSDDAVVLPPNEPTASDKASIHESMEAFLSLPALDVSWSLTKVIVATSGDLAYAYGTYKTSAKDEKGNPFTDNGKVLEIWRKQSDGSWKCVVDTWNTDVPIPAAK